MRQYARIGVPLTDRHCAPAAGKNPDFAVLLGESAFHPVKSQRGHRHVRDLVGRSPGLCIAGVSLNFLKSVFDLNTDFVCHRDESAQFSQKHPVFVSYVKLSFRIVLAGLEVIHRKVLHSQAHVIQ